MCVPNHHRERTKPSGGVWDSGIWWKRFSKRFMLSAKQKMKATKLCEPFICYNSYVIIMSLYLWCIVFLQSEQGATRSWSEDQNNATNNNKQGTNKGVRPHSVVDRLTDKLEGTSVGSKSPTPIPLPYSIQPLDLNAINVTQHVSDRLKIQLQLNFYNLQSREKRVVLL